MYENAWRLGNEKNAAVAFRLAKNYLKAKQFIRAIDISHKILAMHPDYPRIRKEVLEKARAALRP